MTLLIISVALMLAETPTAPAIPEQKTSVCSISKDPSRYLGQQVVVDARLINIGVHGIYLNDPKSAGCILHLGSMADEEDNVFNYVSHSILEPTRVRVDGVVKSEMREDPWGRGPSLIYFLDQMKFTRLQP